MRRSTTLTVADDAEIWRLYIRRVPRSQIAADMKIDRETVTRAITRVRKDLNTRLGDELEGLRTEALEVYDAVQAEAWRRLEACPPTSTAAAGYLSSILESRKQQDRLLGLEEITVNHRGVVLAQIQTALSTAVPIVLPEAMTDD